jgi:4-amino-4-deoxychorismate mutase
MCCSSYICMAPRPAKGVLGVTRTIGTTSTEHGVDSAETKLAELRAELDHLDHKLLEDVRTRIEVCAQIAVLKEKHDIPMLQPGRMKFVHERAQNFARTHNLSPEFLRSLYDLIIGEACRVEDLIIDGPGRT